MLKLIDWQALGGWYDYAGIYEKWADAVPADGCIVEVGVFCGRSLGHLAQMLLDRGKETVELIGIDNFDPAVTEAMLVRNNKSVLGPVLHNYSKEKVEQNLSTYPNLLIIRGQSHRELANLHRQPNYIWIDADHTEAAVKQDLHSAWLAIQRPGTIGGHDYCEKDFPGVFRAWNEFKSMTEQMNTRSEVTVGTLGIPSIEVHFLEVTSRKKNATKK